MIEGLYATQGGGHTSLVHCEGPLAQEKSTKRLPYRPPRRAQSTIDYVYPTPPPVYMRSEPRTVLVQQSSASASASASAEGGAAGRDAGHERPPTIQEEGPSRAVTPAAAAAAAAPASGRPQRPKLGPPRRSYSVMDYEPTPHHHRLSDNLGLADLPSELHYAIFDFLDPIDSTCLGLTNKHFYNIHRRMHGRVPLSVRRSGPNDMEWVWHLAGRVMHGGHADAATLAATTNALAMLRVRGQALCRKCGISRCELHKHIAGWMGPGYEYCTVREKFGPPAPAGAREFCYLSNPKDPHRCGRHRVPKSRPTTPLP